MEKPKRGIVPKWDSLGVVRLFFGSAQCIYGERASNNHL